MAAAPARSQRKAARTKTVRPETSTALATPRWWLIALMALAGAIAFGGAVPGPFQFDDVAAISRNHTIDALWPATTALDPPAGTAVSGRPVVNYTLAVNRAINSGLGIDSQNPHAPAGFRIANIVIHFLSGLLLFGIIRRTMRSSGVPDGWHPHADGVAGVVAAIWLLHPLQTEAVDYVIQRTELLVSAFYLATLYSSIRAWDAARPRARVSWYAAAIIACLLGMGSKEVMVSAPFAVVLYDRAFRLTSWRALAHTPRRWFYVALLLTLIPLALTVAAGARGGTVGFGQGITWYQYLYSQGWAIARYVKLALWPDRLTFDYGEHPIFAVTGALGLAALAASGVVAIAAWRRAPWFAFLATWFFMLLAPSSSIVPISTEIAAERRAYLALIPVLVSAVIGLEVLRQRLVANPRRARIIAWTAASVAIAYFAASSWTGTAAASALGLSSGARVAVALLIRALVAGAAAVIVWYIIVVRDRRWIVAGIVAALTVASARRSALYANAEALWRDAVAKRPENPRAYDNLAAAIIQGDSSRIDEAARVLRKAIAVDSTYVTAYSNLADIELQRGNTAAARALLEHALRINPDYVDAASRLGGVLVKLGETQQGIALLERAASANPTDESLVTLAIGYMTLNRRDDAKSALRRAVAINPRRVDALGYLGAMLLEEGHPDEAVGFIEAAVAAGGATPASYAMLSDTYAQLGRADESARAASIAAAQPGVNAELYLQLGRTMLAIRRAEDAQRYLSRAVELAPNNPEALTRLGLTKAALGATQEAIDLFRRALRAAPGYEPAQRALAAAGLR